MTKPYMTFEVSTEEEAIIRKWHKALQKRLIKDKKAQGGSWGCGPDEIYYGAVGGGLQYIFSPTGVGTILVVQESVSGEQLNVTDANGWKDF